MNFPQTARNSFFKEKLNASNLDSEQIASLKYHDIFDFPLNSTELYEWRLKKRNLFFIDQQIKTGEKLGYFFIKNKENIVAKRLVRQKISGAKLEKAKKYISILGLVLTVKMVGITGALAMRNADENSDIDLIIITQKGSLWFTRAIVVLIFLFLRTPLRRFAEKEQKDKLCLNIWLDESDLLWEKKKRNIFTAHEIAQIVPLINRDSTYERFIRKNKWIKKYWPNAVEIDSKQQAASSKQNLLTKLTSPILYTAYYILQIIEAIAFKLQYEYMKKKITCEIISPTRALFHPNDWSEIVTQRLNNLNKSSS